ncbi:sugar porter family MFS transporter [Gelidibacter gilvus]|uniref:Sugar porter family MFS transporter n=1 Tax=Gelidibacter maritimus TaxID=2761487 RepID=A0A7W2R3R4_9FLAO|nr:sugar porter family MFS transporter [Gelidibacter maritimus]
MNKEVNFAYLSFLSIVAALGGFLFGYDTAVISGTISMVTKQFDLSPVMQGWYVSSALIGSILGVSIAGWFSDLIGRKKSMGLSALFFLISATGCALATTMDILVVYRILGGIGIGMISIISPMYISEIAHEKIRGSLVTLYQLAITLGFLGAYLVNFKLLDHSTSAPLKGNHLMDLVFIKEVWRGMLGMEAIPAAIFLIIVFLLPESPRWLFMKNKENKAVKVLSDIFRSKERVMIQLKDMQQALSKQQLSTWETLKTPALFKAVLIGAAIAILGQFMGVNAVLYYGPSIFEQSGLSGGDALFYQVLVGGVNVLTTILAFYIIDKVGRKKLVYFGVTGMIVTLLLISGYFYTENTLSFPSHFLLIFFLAYIFFTAISISAVIFVLLSEMYPTKIRGIAMSISGFSLWVGTFIVGQLTPWLLETLSPEGTFLLFAIMCLPYMYIIWKLVPETTGKTLEEIEEFWK